MSVRRRDISNVDVIGRAFFLYVGDDLLNLLREKLDPTQAIDVAALVPASS
jgi:hypothetical protein